MHVTCWTVLWTTPVGEALVEQVSAGGALVCRYSLLGLLGHALVKVGSGGG